MNRTQIQLNLKNKILKILKNTGIKSKDHLYLSVDMGGLFSDYVNQPEEIKIIYKNKIFYKICSQSL